MNTTDIPLLAMLKGKLSYDTQRQTVIARNVANADTPNYAPTDLKPFTFDQAMQSAGGGGLALAHTASTQLEISTQTGDAAAFGGLNAPDSEVRLDGNHVVLEEQMIKVNEAQSDFSAAIGFYQQSMQLIKTALKKPGS